MCLSWVMKMEPGITRVEKQELFRVNMVCRLKKINCVVEEMDVVVEK